MCGEICGDNRFEIIATAKAKLIEATNIESSPEEMAVLDNILFRMWQMGWLPDLTIKRTMTNREWIEKLTDEDFAAVTITNFLSAPHTFVNWLKDEHEEIIND